MLALSAPGGGGRPTAPTPHPLATGLYLSLATVSEVLVSVDCACNMVCL